MPKYKYVYQKYLSNAVGNIKILKDKQNNYHMYYTRSKEAEEHTI